MRRCCSGLEKSTTPTFNPEVYLVMVKSAVVPVLPGKTVPFTRIFKSSCKLTPLGQLPLLKALGIGLVIALFAKLAEVFSRNQKVLDIFSNVTTSLSIAFNDLFSIFEGGLPSVNEIGQAIKRNIIERFNSMLKVTGLVGKALTKFFEGDFQGAMDAVKEAGAEAVDVLTGVDGSLEKMTGYVDKIYEQAAATTELANASRLAEVRLQGLIEKYDFQAEQLRQIRDDERLTIKERIDANEALGKVLDEQRKAQLKQAGISVASAQAQIAATGNNIDNQVALQQALNELAATEAQIAGFRSEQLINQAALEKELDEQRLERTTAGLEDVSQDPKVLLAQSASEKQLILGLSDVDEQVPRLGPLGVVRQLSTVSSIPSLSVSLY